MSASVALPLPALISHGPTSIGTSRAFLSLPVSTMTCFLSMSTDFTRPLTVERLIVYFGFCVSLAGAALAAYLLFVSFYHTPPPGWTSLAVLILLIGGFVIMSTGVTGLYIGKIFEQVKERPLYLTRERIN